MKYRVHVYLTVRVPFDDIEAESQEAAIEAARKLVDDYSFRLKDAEYADEITNFLVDEDGDEEYERSQSYDANGKADQHPYLRETA
jgi:hypothetical protein